MVGLIFLFENTASDIGDRGGFGTRFGTKLEKKRRDKAVEMCYNTTGNRY